MLILLTCIALVRGEEIIGKTHARLTPNGNDLEGLLYNVDGVKVKAFLGIPFGKPPVGSLRFAPPEPVNSWQGVADATKKAKCCWQYMFSGFDQANPAARIWANNTEMDEDCLYLNVWTPDDIPANTKLPVMVWIFGGGFFSGSAALDVYNGVFLAARERVIVVSMQYRVGAFGFLYLPDGQVGGNMGLLDQQLAMKWVQTNIGIFGGDSNRVTLFGESAGGVSVTLHYIAPSSQALFSRMIAQSSSVLLRWAMSTPESAHERSIAVRKAQIRITALSI